MKSWYVKLLVGLAFLCGVSEAKVIDSLQIEGLSVNSANVVRNAMELSKGKEFNSADLQESLKRIFRLGLFRSADFFVLAETDSTISLRLLVEEFPVCEGIEYEGNKKLKEKDFEEKVKLKPGRVATDVALFQSEKAIRDLYAEKGFLLAHVAAERIPTKIPGNALVKFSIKEGSKVRIKEISFSGNKEVKSAKLERKLKTKENRWWRSGDFDEDLYRQHLDTLVLFYNDLGYLDASVIKDSVWFSDSRKDIYIQITIDEGKKYYAGNFFFSGNKILDSDTLAPTIQLKEGKPFQKSRFDMTKYLVENAYREEGYLWVRVEDRRSFRNDTTIDVNFEITEGRPAIVRKVDIRGNGKTSEKVIRREIDLLPGQKYKQSLMVRSRQKIYALNYFSNVMPDLTPNEDGTIDLVFDITEKDNIGQLSIGAAYSEVDGFVGTFSTSIPNFRGVGQELGVNLEYGKNRTDVRLRFIEPWSFDTPTRLSGEVFYNRSIISSVDTLQSYGFIAGAGRSKLKWPDDRFTINGTYQLSYENSSRDSARTENLEVREKGILSRMSMQVRRYDLDYAQFPTRGSMLTISPQVAGLGGDFQYLKGTVGYEHYFPLPLKFVVGSRSKIGLITPLTSRGIVIGRTDLFRTGGVWNVDGDLRGYEEYSIGGYYGNPPEQGIAMFTSTLELRYPILDQQLYLGVFGDIGNTWSGMSDIDITDVYKGVGFGLRINVPMLGIMGFDFAWGLDDPRSRHFDGDPKGFKFHFLMNRGF